jgi:hypothetical protein
MKKLSQSSLWVGNGNNLNANAKILPGTSADLSPLVLRFGVKPSPNYHGRDNLNQTDDSDDRQESPWEQARRDQAKVGQRISDYPVTKAD